MLFIRGGSFNSENAVSVKTGIAMRKQLLSSDWKLSFHTEICAVCSLLGSEYNLSENTGSHLIHKLVRVFEEFNC